MKLNMEPQVSVIVVNYNGGDLLKKCIRHLRAQTITKAEFIIVDNGSEDSSLANVPDDDSRFRVLELNHNTGFAYANNRGVELAIASWIALLNCDAFPEPDWLERLLSAANSRPEFRFFGSHQYLTEPEGHLDGTGDMLARNGRAWRRDHGSPASEGTNTSDEVFGACAASALYDKAAFLEVGGFEESFFCYFEDVDLSFKLRLAGYRCLHVADAVVHHVGSASTGPTSDFQIYHGYRNLVWAYCKNMPLDLLIANFPRFLVLVLVSLRVWAARGKGSTIRRAFWHAFLGLPKVLVRKRPMVQRLRKVSSAEIARHLSR